MTSKIRIKLGQIEVEYEGSEEFIKQGLPDLIKAISDLTKTANLNLSSISSTPGILDTTSSSQSSGIQMSAGTIAAKLKCTSGTDLVMAAAASLTLVKNQGTFTRQQILDEMKTATAYYKSSYLSNLTQHLTSLIKSGKLLERSSGQYALPAEIKSDLETRLAN
jgi:hypothetical protein